MTMVRESTWTGREAVRDALAVAGIDLRSLLDQAGRLLASGDPYLVGALAAGLGNRGGPVDIHQFRPDRAQPAPPRRLVLGGVPVTLAQYPIALVSDVSGWCASGRFRLTRLGPVGLDPAPDQPTEQRLIRWLTALPLRPGLGPLVREEARAPVLGVLLRAAMEELVTLAALAALADRAGGPAGGGPAGQRLWQQAGRQALEVVCRSRGDVAIGATWLPTRTARVGLAEPVAHRGYTVSTRRDFELLCRQLAVPTGDPLAVTAVRPEAGARQVWLGRQRFLVTRHERVFPDWVAVSAATGAAADAVGAQRLLHALRTGQQALTLDHDAMEELLCR